ncbi:ATP-dependent Clp protease adaptor ClpS [Pontibacter diazotrophicus]|uniref:ATP-dependent Clp protease adaptor ClpS n=1 Tax=Pontibacter diazotrophicus TaxID=1400979 RepID=A0A3D8LB99_9BACT|nr:ATP-dependent Clp protease adaptor ClpS [Pontibacter diazotrophicus]RDV14677.1 ATP-dependent Clp protease adaptor ClpS [Pontibacter diazotrophicus]
MNWEREILHKEEVEVELLEESTDLRNLVVYNDDVNTFDHVIETLIKVCRHTQEQAEQCTMLIHYKGKCTVKVGSYEELMGMCTSLHQKDLSADIE